MNKSFDLNGSILDLLGNDDELFEAIFYGANDLVYNNINNEIKPIHANFGQFPINVKYSVQSVFNSVKEFIEKGFIECYQNIRIDNRTHLKKIDSPIYNDFSTFSSYWLRLSKKGEKELEK